MAGPHAHSHAHSHMHGHAEAARLSRGAAIATAGVALLLVLLKAWSAAQTNSVSMLGSLADTLLDFVASLTTLVAVWIAAKPDGPNHRFGRGKAEALAALVQVVLVTISALSLAVEAIQHLATGAPVESPENGVVVSLLAMAATLALVLYQRWVLQRARSVAIAATHLHYKADVALNLAVIVALGLYQRFNLAWVDPLFALGIAAWLARGAWLASREALTQLMDTEWPLDKRERFLEVLRHHPELRGVHDLRTRTSGARDFVQFHALVDGTMTVAEAHRVMDEIEHRLMAEFPGVEVLIHPDPEGHEEGHAPAAAQDLLAPRAS